MLLCGVVVVTRRCLVRRVLKAVIFVIVACATGFIFHRLSTSFRWHAATDQLRREQQPNYRPALNAARRPSLKLMSLAYHAAPVYDLKDFLRALGVTIVERAMNNYGCQYFNSCRHHDPLKIIDNRAIHWHLGYGDVEEFYRVYRDDPEFQTVDAFLCMHPAATCELFIPFRRPLIVIATIRYDNGRVASPAWRRWNRVLVDDIASDPVNVVAANNRYDVEYMRYYTGISPQLLPSFCGYTGTEYRPTRTGFLLGFRRDTTFGQFFMEELTFAREQLNVDIKLTPVRDLYPTYQWSDLAAHPGIVPLPCQPSMMSLFELYRMNVPMFLPSHRLLVEWHSAGHRMLDEMYSHFPDDVIEPHPIASQGIPDPNVRNSTKSLEHWLLLADWFTDLMPHVILYDSGRDLVRMLNETTMTSQRLSETSRLMAAHNRRLRLELVDRWKDILIRVAENRASQEN